MLRTQSVMLHFGTTHILHFNNREACIHRDRLVMLKSVGLCRLTIIKLHWEAKCIFCLSDHLWGKKKQSIVPTCFKTTSIIPVHKKLSPTCLDDYQPTARSMEDAIDTSLHFALTYLEHKNTYSWMLLSEYSFTFNIIHLKLSLSNWTLDFVTSRLQSIRLDNHSSSTLTLSTGAPQGCALSPLLYSHFTHNCLPIHHSNSIMNFMDNTSPYTPIIYSVGSKRSLSLTSTSTRSP